MHGGAKASVQERLSSVADVLMLPQRSLHQLGRRFQQPAGRNESLVVRYDQCQLALRELDIDWQPRTDTNWVIAMATPTPAESQRLGPELIEERQLRLAFHGAVHIAFAKLDLDQGQVRQRVRQLGRAEFEEIRYLLERDDRLRQPSDDREVYIEFAASYLELCLFAPELVPAAFPGLTHLERIRGVVATDIDVASLSAACGLNEPALKTLSVDPPPLSQSKEALVGGAAGRPTQINSWRQRWLLGAARRARHSKRHTQCAVLAARVVDSSDAEFSAEAVQLLDSAVERMSAALDATSAPDLALSPNWPVALRVLALTAAKKNGPRAATAKHVLGMLERAARIQRWPLHVVQVSWFKRGARRRISVHQAPLLQSVQVARLLAAANERSGALHLPAAEAAVVLPVLGAVAQSSTDRARRSLSRRLSRVLERAGLLARTRLERLARMQLVEALTDRILARGFLSLPQLRDTISSSDLKLPDVQVLKSGRGDPLLAADALLARSLGGVYRRGDVYLRALQKVSSLSFGTAVGRALLLFCVLPLAGAFTLLEGAQHLVNPGLRWAGLPLLPAPDISSVAFTTAILLGLIHSHSLRTLARQLLELLGMLVALLLFRLPRLLLSLPAVQRWLSRPFTRWLLRHLLTPALVAGVAFIGTPLPAEDLLLRLVSAVLTFIGTSWLMKSQLGFWLEGFVTERLAPTWRVLGRRWLPELLIMVSRTFAALVESMERLMAGVDDLLRSRRRPTGFPLLLLTTMILAWGMMAYVVRLYVTLLVEPELNPLKHFPVVTVAHKLMLPFLPTLLVWVEKPFAILGPFLGGALAGLTVFLLPSVFGFLAWELKENYRLYEATRPRDIQPARFGPNGETLRELLVVGLHSGTLPKSFERLRRAAQRSDERRQRARAAHKRPPPFTHDPELQRFRQSLEAARRAIARVVERELLPTITDHPSWSHGSLLVDRIELSSNRVRVQLTCPALIHQPSELTFEQLGGHIVAGFSNPGFVSLLEGAQLTLFDNALGVFYHRAGVSLVREQLTHLLPGGDYDIREGTIAVFSDAGQLAVTYPIDVRWPRQLAPRIHDPHTTLATPSLHARELLFDHQPITWANWQRSWHPQSAEQPKRLFNGPSLLPQ